MLVEAIFRIITLLLCRTEGEQKKCGSRVAAENALGSEQIAAEVLRVGVSKTYVNNQEEHSTIGSEKLKL